MSFKKKLTRKQLLNQPDEFISLTARVSEYLRTQSRTVVFGAAIVIAGVALVMGVKFYKLYQLQEASRLEDAAYNDYHGQVEGESRIQGAVTGGPVFASREKLYQSALGKYQKLIDNYPDTPSAKRAKFYIANCYYHLKKYDKSSEVYERVLSEASEKNVFYRDALLGLAYAQEGAGNYVKASETFQRVIDLTTEEDSKLPFYLDLARVYKQNNDLKKAVQIYEKMLEMTSDENQKFLINSKLFNVKSNLENY